MSCVVGLLAALWTPAAPPVRLTLESPLRVERPSSTQSHSLAARPFDFSLLYTLTRDRFDYYFENPSSFDTPFLIPHHFTQRYDGDAQWLALRLRYPGLGARWETEIGLAPARVTRGDDFDTFLQPDGDVVRSGTTGNVSMRSLRLAQLIGLKPQAGLSWQAGYRVRRDRSDFHEGHKSISHAKPPALERSLVTTRETTISEVHEIWFRGERRLAFGPTWAVTGSIGISPATIARLTTRLPDKYPGREIVFTATGFAVGGQLGLSRTIRRVEIEAAIDYGRAWSYRPSMQFHRTMLGATVGLGLAPGR